MPMQTTDDFGPATIGQEPGCRGLRGIRHALHAALNDYSCREALLAWSDLVMPGSLRAIESEGIVYVEPKMPHNQGKPSTVWTGAGVVQTLSSKSTKSLKIADCAPLYDTHFQKI